MEKILTKTNSGILSSASCFFKKLVAERRVIARVLVSVFGFAVALYCLIQIFSTSIFDSEARVWMNVPYLVITIIGGGLFYWAAFTNFDDNYPKEGFFR